MARLCNKPKMENEVQYFPLHFEEQSRFIPVIIRDEESVPTYFGEVIVGTAKNQYFILEGDYGTLTARQLRILNESALNGLILNDQYYSLSVNKPNEKVYSAYSTDPNVVEKIRINTSTGEWEYVHSENTVLDDHIRNTTVHITAQERSFWNNKLNFSINEESLDFNRN